MAAQGTVARTRGAVAASVLVLGLLAGCGGGGSGAAPATVGTTTTTAPAAGHGTVTIGGDSQAFAVTRCTDGAGASGDPLAKVEFELVGRGSDGTTAFTVRVLHVTSDSGVGTTNITETAIVATGSGAQEKGLVARRSRVDGTWLDLNQRSEHEPLIVRRGSLVEVAARFGPDGGREGDAGIVPGVLRARCPA